MAKKNQAEDAQGYSRKFLEYSRAIKPRTKLNPNDIDELKRRFVNYCEQTQEYDMHYLNRTCYKALGLTKEQMTAYTTTKYNENPERGDLLQEILDFLASYRENAIASGLLPPIPGIFMQKNYDGMKDTTDINMSRDTTEVRDLKVIAARYKDIIDVEFKEKRRIPQNTGGRNK